MSPFTRPALVLVGSFLAALAAPAPVALAEEESVRPGVNEPYRKIESQADVQPWVERFEREGREVHDHRDAIVEAIGLAPGMTVADLGAGTGLFVGPLASAVGPEGRVLAVDIVEAFLEHVRERARAAGLRNVETVLCTDRSSELPAGSVDRVFSCDTYHHLEHPLSTMRSVHRALRCDGEMVIVDFERIEGQSSEWILDHVRAGKDVVIDEIESVGFELVEEVPLLEENYVLRFRKVEAAGDGLLRGARSR